MKRWLTCVLILLLALSGCTGDRTTEPTGQTAESLPPAKGIYDPQSAVEQQTGGAVRAYPLGIQDCDGMVFMGKDILVFSGAKTGKTTLTRFSGADCVQKASVTLTAAVDLQKVRTSETQLCYYDLAGKCIVFLNQELSETRRIMLPEEMVGTPVLGQDLSTVFYCTESQIRALDMDTGISRLIRQQTRQQSLRQSILKDTVLLCDIMEEGKEVSTEFFAVKDGAFLGRTSALADIHTGQESFYLYRKEGSLQENLFGELDGQVRCLWPQDEEASLFAVSGKDWVVTAFENDEQAKLELYHLTDAKRKASVALTGLQNIGSFQTDATGTYIWFRAYDPQKQTDGLYRWDFQSNFVTDEKVYAGYRYTREDPDIEGLQQCKDRADALSGKYSITITVGEDVLQPAGGILVTEYQVPVIRQGLDVLESALDRFPEGFLKTLDKNIPLQISMVRQVESGAQNPVDAATGTLFWADGKAHIVLVLGEAAEQTLYRELCHVLDTFIIGNSIAYDIWDTLNPQGFQYDGSYQQYQNRGESQFLTGEMRAFIDSFAMTYAAEDRGLIFAYAMMEGNEDCFASVSMQQKLRQMGIGIREAFGLKKDTRSFPWEQYLKEPLAYKKK